MEQFELVDPATRRPLVRGAERVETVGEEEIRRTVYSSLTGVPAKQVEESRLDPDTLALRSYHFEDEKSGELTDLEVTGDRAKIQYRPRKGAQVKSEVIDWGPRAISGKVLPELIARRWRELAQGETVRFDLLVPFRLETIAFRAVRQRPEKGRVTIRVEPDNWLIRKLAPPIDFVYEVPSAPAPPRLIKYRGPSVVEIAGERNRMVEIEFR